MYLTLFFPVLGTELKHSGHVLYHGPMAHLCVIFLSEEGLCSLGKQYNMV